MSGLICVAGGKGAPGASTVALALALASGPERTVTLVDADPDGGALAARLGVAATPGLVSLSAAARHGFRPDLVGLHTQHIRPGVELIASPPSAEQICSALAGVGRPFAEALAAIDAVADVGRWQLRSPATELVREAVATHAGEHVQFEHAHAEVMRLHEHLGVEPGRCCDGVGVDGCGHGAEATPSARCGAAPAVCGVASTERLDQVTMIKDWQGIRT